MNIPDEYWTDEVPTEAGHYAYRRKNATWVIESCCIQHVECKNGKVLHSYEHGSYRLPPIEAGSNVQWCRLAPAVELDRLKAENKKLRELGGKLRDSAEKSGFTSFDDSRVIENAEKRIKAWDAYIAHLKGRAE